MTSPKRPVPVIIDFVADIAHPWAVINLITLDRAMQALRGEVVAKLQFQPIELSAQLGPGGETVAERMQRQMGWSHEQAQLNENAAQDRARALGIAFTANPSRRAWNTFDAHRLMRWAVNQNAQRALFLALADAGCNQGEDLSSRDALARIAGGIGLDAAAAYEVLASDQFASDVRTIEAHYRRMGVFESPTLVINARHRINGAVGYDQMVSGMRQIAALSA